MGFCTGPRELFILPRTGVPSCQGGAGGQGRGSASLDEGSRRHELFSLTRGHEIHESKKTMWT